MPTALSKKISILSATFLFFGICLVQQLIAQGQSSTAGSGEAARIEWLAELRQKAERGEAESQRLLGSFYENGSGVKQNYATAARWYRNAAEQGDAVSQFYLASLYDNGFGVPLNHTEAASWYRRAAEQSHAEAQHNLGEMYRLGRGVL